MMKHFVLVLAVLLVTTACSGSGDAPPVAESEPTSEPTVTAAPEPTTEPEPTAAPEPADEPTAEADPGAANFNSPDLRDLIISGIASSAGQPREVATCMLDNTLAQGFTMEDLVLRGGDDDVVAAITDSLAVCAPE